MYEADKTIPRVAKNESKKLHERTLLGEATQIMTAESMSAVILSPLRPKKHGVTESISIITVLTTHGERPAIHINASPASETITALVFLPERVLLRRKLTMVAIIEVCIPLTARMWDIPRADISLLKLIGNAAVSPTKRAIA